MASSKAGTQLPGSPGPQAGISAIDHCRGWGVTGGTGIQSNWRALTAVNPGQVNIGLSEGHRGAAMSRC